MTIEDMRNIVEFTAFSRREQTTHGTGWRPGCDYLGRPTRPPIFGPHETPPAAPEPPTEKLEGHDAVPSPPPAA